MARKKEKINENAKSTVLNMRDEFDWGRILFDACYVFNYSLAEHWKQYVHNYNPEKVVADTQEQIKQMTNRRNEIINQKNKLKENCKSTSHNANSFYKQYINTLPIGSFVREYRNNSNMTSEFQNLIKVRKEAYNNYRYFVDENAMSIKEEIDYTKSHLFATRNLGTKARTLKKIINTHELELSHPIHEDVDVIYDFLISEEQAERLMGVCVNILNAYSEKEFSTTLNLQDRERIADNIYDYFSTFKHNYDFITGCYYVGDDNKLHLKDIEQLKNKFYNGYYFTIRGFVQRSYAAAREEKYNIRSIDLNWNNNDEEEGHNKDIDKYASDCYFNDENNNSSGYSVLASDNCKFGEGMISFWKVCQEYLIQNADNMANELFHQMKCKFHKMNYYSSMVNNQIMINVVLNTLKGIDEELKRGRNVNSKLKHIVLDAMGGAENKAEWKFCAECISTIMMKYINKFFIYNNSLLYENELNG